MSTNTPAQNITLYFKQGSSDKTYMAAIEPQGSGFVVNFAFGRRGSTLQTGTKTATPVDYPTARKIYDKLVAEKTAKGYSHGEPGTPYQHTDQESRSTGIFPQLLNSIDEAEAGRLIFDRSWAMQEKLDGKRILIRKSGGEVIGINRKSLAVALPEPVAQCVSQLASDAFILDGECIGDLYHAFDLLEQDGTDMRSRSLRSRLEALKVLLTNVGGDFAVRLVQTITGAADKQAFLAELRERKAEGAVFKLLTAPYSPGRPASGGHQLKLKFTATASCLVARANAGKRSVALVLMDGKNQVPVGNVTIPGRQPIPGKGAIVDICYLYAFPGEGGSLYQPVYQGQRDDIGADACTVGQLKFKPTDSPETSEEDIES